MQTVEPLRLTTEPDAAARSRVFAAQRLAGWCTEDVLDNAQLVLTELVTNAQLHGAPPITVNVEPTPEGARVSVEDTGRGRLVIPAQSSDAMTGRGLRLVAAVASSWGVDPEAGGGKTVWVELQAGASETPQSPDMDLDALLSAWDDLDDEREHTVRLGAVPTGLLLEAKRHIDNVVRELTFERAGASEPLPPEVEALIDTVTGGFARARAGIKEQAAAAAGRGDVETELVLTLPASSVQAGEAYLLALDEADRYAREARLLTLETPPLHRLFRRWYVTALIEQLRALAAGDQPRQPKPFVEVLVEEVGQLSSLRDTAHRLDLLQRVNAALTDTTTADAMASTVIASAVRELGALTARVYLERDGVLRTIGQAAASAAGRAAGQEPLYEEIPLDADLPGAVVYRTGQVMVLRSLAQLAERFPELSGVYDSERVLHVVPLEVGQHRLGVLSLSFPPLSQHDEHAQTAYVRALADALAQGLERIDVASRLTTLADSVAADQGAAAVKAALDAPSRPGSPSVWVGEAGARRLQSLADAARAIAGARSIPSLLDVVISAARSIIGTHQAVATRLYGGSWEGAVTHVSLSDEYAEYRTYDVVPQGLGVINVVTRENRPLRLTGDQLRNHPEFRGLADAPGHPPLPDYLAAPLISRSGENIGLIQLAHKVDGSEFDDADEAALVQLALMVSAAVEHVELAMELEQAMTQLRDEQDIVNALHDVGQAVTARLEHAEVVQTVTDAATQMTGAQFGAFFYNVIAETGESLSLYAISGVPREAFSKFPMPRNTQIFSPTFHGEGVVRLDDVTADPRYGLMTPHYGMPAGHLPVRSYLAVPVKLSDGEVIGGLFFGHADPGVFDASAERLAVGIAGYAAIALENGRLYDAARRESRAKEEVAAALEQPLQPPDLPSIPGLEVAAVFEPLGGAGQLGGDFYDLFPLGGGRWMLALGDVAGKGPEAAAVTGLVRHTLWGAAQYATDPASVGDAVNAALLRQSTERFATLALAVLTPSSRGVLVDAVWAGHPRGLLVRHDDGVELISGDGLPVGMFSRLGLEPVRFTILPGETLLLHTDGLLEREGAVLDEQHLVDVVTAHRDQPLAEMLRRVNGDIAALHPPRDDVAAVALRAVSS